LQVLRLTKAMRVVDLNLDNGDLKAVEPLLKVIAQLDKYHALSLAAPAPAGAARASPPTAGARRAGRSRNRDRKRRPSR
jgi:hypothetical protein